MARRRSIMCGIAGVVYADPSRAVDERLLSAMADSLRRRGPDAEGIWSAPHVGLAHRRLSIIDLEGGRQPFVSEDGSLAVTFNGEIYGFRELRTKLEAKGHRFRSTSDTEVLLHAYREFGDAMVDHLRGMFAFGLWDVERRRLLLARDRVGIKPLYLHRGPEHLVFASEAKGLLASGLVARAADPAAVAEYLALGFVGGSGGIFHGTEKLPPGCLLSVTPDELRAEPRRYWRLNFEPEPDVTDREWAERLNEKLREAVRLHLVADVPVGAFLSGGLDSGAIVGLANEQSAEPIRTFTIGFDDEAYSEAPFARELADVFGTLHSEEIVHAEAGSLLDELTEFFDEPFADSSAIPTFVVSRLASRSVKVVLSGDGGDEAFAGYDRYVADLSRDRFRRWTPHLARPALFGLSKVWEQADWLPYVLRSRAILGDIAKSAGEAYAGSVAMFRPGIRKRLLIQDSNGAPEQAVLRVFEAAPHDDLLSRMLATDTETLLPDGFLVKVDRASMAHGLEVRPPLLDHEVLELAARIPSTAKIRNGATKWIFREVARSILPEQWFDRPKRGFDPPLDRWFDGALSEELREIAVAARSPLDGLVDREVVIGLLDLHRSRRRRLGRQLWSLLTLAKWSKRYLAAPSARGVS